MLKTSSDFGLIARARWQRWLVIAAAVIQVLATLLPQLGLGTPIGDQSDQARTLITPAGWAFSIWGPLFAGSILYGIYQALPAQLDNPLLNRIRMASAGAFLGNAAWAVFTQFAGLQFWSALIIAFTLACLLAIYRTLALEPRRFTVGEQWLVALPLSALGAWLTAATIINVAASLDYHGIEGGASGPMIAAAVTVVGGVIASAAIWAGRGNPWYALVFLWALAAIYAAGGRESSLVGGAAILSALLVAATAIARLAVAENRNHWFKPI